MYSRLYSTNISFRSICIPIYILETYLSKCLYSILYPRNLSFEMSLFQDISYKLILCIPVYILQTYLSKCLFSSLYPTKLSFRRVFILLNILQTYLFEGSVFQPSVEGIDFYTISAFVFGLKAVDAVTADKSLDLNSLWSKAQEFCLKVSSLIPDDDNSKMLGVSLALGFFLFLSPL